MWNIGGAARGGMGGRRAETGILRGLRADSRKGSHLGAGRHDGESVDVQEGRS